MIKYAIYAYKNNEIDREYVYDTMDEAQEKFNKISAEGVYSYFWGDVDFIKLVKIKQTEDCDTILKCYKELY